MPARYLHFDGQTHLASNEAELTAAGEPVPDSHTWTNDQGDGDMCPACFRPAMTTRVKPSKAKAKKG